MIVTLAQINTRPNGSTMAENSMAVLPTHYYDKHVVQDLEKNRSLV